MRVTFRATFRGLKTTGFKFPNPPPSTVEVFKLKGQWLAREATSKHLFKFAGTPSHGTMKDVVAENFDRQETGWVPFDGDGNRLDPATFIEDPNGNFAAVELTHVSKFGSDGATHRPNYFVTFCGEEAFVKNILSVRGKKPPTCPKCKPEWEKVKPEDRLR